jgi:5-methylcytosine-specific restriction endonuclease McrA
MAKRQPNTPRSRIRAALRQLWLRSRERAAALKAESYTCEECNRKQSKAKGKRVDIEVHHLDGVEWDHLINEVYRVLLVNPDRLQVLCKECHAEKINTPCDVHGVPDCQSKGCEIWTK